MGGLGISALALAALAGWTLWAVWGPVPGAPLAASVLGAGAAAELLRFRHAQFRGFETDPFWMASVAATGLTALLAAAFAGRVGWLAQLPRPRTGIALAAGLLVALGFLTGPRFRPEAPQRDGSQAAGSAPPVLLIVLDTVRADHLAQYGYHRDTMPALGAFLERHAIPARSAVATSPWTLPTHGSLFTGLYPPRHGAHGARVDTPEPPPAFFYSLRKDVPTLAGLLSDAGYWSVGISANYGPLSPAFGLDRGFDLYRALPEADYAMKSRSPWRAATARRHLLAELDALPPFRSSAFFGPAPSYRRAEEITGKALKVLEAADHRRPFFLFLNYLDAHAPYLPPTPYRDRFPGRDDRLQTPGLVADLKKRVYFEDERVTPRERRHLNALYDGELAYLDSRLAPLLRRLEQHPRWKDMLLVITSDHGESFGDHGVLTHRSSLYEEQIRVPLFVKEPAKNQGEWGSVVSSVDVFATVLHHAGLEAPSGIDGVSRGRARREIRAWLHSYQEEFARERPERFDKALRSVQNASWKLIESSKGEVELYDLARDPEEHENRASRNPARRAAMRASLKRLARDRPATRSEQSLSRQTRERLRELGYIR